MPESAKAGKLATVFHTKTVQEVTSQEHTEDTGSVMYLGSVQSQCAPVYAMESQNSRGKQGDELINSG